MVTNNSISTPAKKLPFAWQAANIYFLLTDRFNNGDTLNDVNFDRTLPTAPLRGFMGGDLVGITQKIKEGYFTDLGVNAIWFSPVLEQIHGQADEGTGKHLWLSRVLGPKTGPNLDPNFGTIDDLRELVKTAHDYQIRVIMDVVLNHTGPGNRKKTRFGLKPGFVQRQFVPMKIMKVLQLVLWLVIYQIL